jgi:hypothetical protein
MWCRVLDKLAEAFHVANGSPQPRRVVMSIDLRRQFSLPVTPTHWRDMAAWVQCPLPPLQRLPTGLWTFALQWTTVWDVAAHIAVNRPEWEPPRVHSPREWDEAQIFIGVRDSLAESGNLYPAEVVRSARLVRDLGFD